MAPDGIPEFIPPKWVDPKQVPRRNTLHHLGRRSAPEREPVRPGRFPPRPGSSAARQAGMRVHPTTHGLGLSRSASAGPLCRGACDGILRGLGTVAICVCGRRPPRPGAWRGLQRRVPRGSRAAGLVRVGSEVGALAGIARLGTSAPLHGSWPAAIEPRVLARSPRSQSRLWGGRAIRPRSTVREWLQVRPTSWPPRRWAPGWWPDTGSAVASPTHWATCDRAMEPSASSRHGDHW